MIVKISTFFRILADDTRLRSVLLMMEEGELCVQELTHALGLSQPKVSRHLAFLREAGILETRRKGTWVYYRINPQLPEWLHAIIRNTYRGVIHTEPYISDSKRLEQMWNQNSAETL